MPRAKRSLEATQDMRRRLIDAARETIESDGLAAVTARGLAKRLGCSVGAIYTVTPTLDAITLEANAAELEALREALEDRRLELGAAGPRETIQAFADVYLGFAEERPKSWAAIFERDAEGEPPEWYRARQTGLFELLERALEPLTASPQEARVAARTLWAAFQGMLALAMAGHVGRVSETEPKALAKYLVEVFLSGLEARRG